MSELLHLGTKYHSGRFPYGSGENPFQHDKTGFYREYKKLKDKGMSTSQIIKYFDETYYGGNGTFNTSVLRAYVTIGKEQQEKANISRALYLRNERQMGATAIGREMGVPESTVRTWLDPNRKERMESTRALAEVLKNQVEEKAKSGKYLDVGIGTETALNCSDTKLKAAMAVLQDEGYTEHTFFVKQVGTGKNTTIKVLAKEGTEWKDVISNMDNVEPVTGVQPSHDKTYFEKIPKPVGISLDRVNIKYAEEGGSEKDGLIEIRPGVADLSLGENNYAQVRIMVDGTHYLKGMAVYGDPKDFKDGQDIIYNSSKSIEKGVYGSLKKLEKVKKNGEETDEIDWDKPFGASIKRVGDYIGEDGKVHQSAVNIVNEDEDWDKWSKNLASQFLSKQTRSLAKRQLGLAYDAKAEEFDEINELTNPTLKKKLLEEFADGCDSAAVHLKAAPLPGQATHVILPITSLKDNEIYAPNYNTGDEVCLIRYPHGGTFEIPRLIVNNNNKKGKEIIGHERTAVGINANVAEQLSGADFDGDTVVVLPSNNQTIKTKGRLDALKDFDDKKAYEAYKGMPKTGPNNGFHKQAEMGKVTNLITDMTIGGANDADLANAVKYSMVVIDAEKHNLDWRRAYKECNIAYLKEKYQGGANKGASTLISKASSEEHVNIRREVTSANDKTLTEQERKDWLEGKKVYKEKKNVDFLKAEPDTSVKSMTPEEKEAWKKMTPEEKKEWKDSKKEFTQEQWDAYKKAKQEYQDTGVVPEGTAGLKFKETKRKQSSTKMAEVEDAHELSSGTPMEEIYADHANKLKSLANAARKEARTMEDQKYSPSAAKVYAEEVKSLDNKLKTALLNAPLERQAQMIANKVIAAKKADDPELKTDKDQLKKVSNRALADARAQVGSKKTPIKIEPKEWEAIQAGAISKTKLSKIFANTDDEELKKLATPHKEKNALSSAQVNRAKAMLAAGFTQAEVAQQFGVSTSTINKFANKK